MSAWAEVDLQALEHNCQVIKNSLDNEVRIIAVVKADAYGFGIERVVPIMEAQGVVMFAVISLQEARAVRAVTHKPILIMGHLDIKQVTDAMEEGFILSLFSKEIIAYYERIAARMGKVVPVHVKVETGLNRLGLSVEEAQEYLTTMHHFPHLKAEAIFSHLATAVDNQSNEQQLRVLQDLLVDIQSKAHVLPIHLVSSAALTFKQGYFDAVRIGLAFYGASNYLPDLQPVLTCKSVVMQVKNIEKGETVSYGRLFTAEQPMRLAVVAIGYADGLSRAQAGKLEVLIGGARAAQVGQVCMNHIVVDVTNIEAKRGDEVVVLGSQKDKHGNITIITADELAKCSMLGHHETIVRLTQSLSKTYL